MIFHQRSLPLTFQLRVSFCARFPSHGSVFCAHISPFIAWRTSLLACFCVVKWEYVGIFRRIGRTPVPVDRIAPNYTSYGERRFYFWAPLRVIYLRLEHVGALKRHRMRAILN